MRVIFDCDPGHDDIIAIMTALAHPEKFEILGFTTVAGNQTIDKVTNNLLKVLDYLEVSLPVARGAARPLRRDPEPQPAAHGESGMDGPVLPEARTEAIEADAVSFLYQTIVTQDEPVTILELAPQTNLALLIRQHPDVQDHIDSIRMMGGSLHLGNMLARSEFNIYHDPEAARIVFQSGIPIVMSGLEVCLQAKTYFSEYEQLAQGGRASRLVFDLLEFFSKYKRKQGKNYTTVFDLVPVIQLLEPSIFTSSVYNINIETEGTLCRGMTVLDAREQPDVKNDITVLETVSQKRYMELLMEAVRVLDARFGEA